MYGINKYMIDINIETLAGTTFSLKVSPLESIQSLKAKIQRHEGIPISHQHLVWKTSELEDNKCLNDYNIPNGATIRMVLALRGGPINTKRMTTEDTLLRDVSDLMEEIQEESNLWNNNNESSQSINKHVTLLLFRDGDHLNLLRVIDRGDITSPISGAMSAASMYVPYDETDHETNNMNDENHNKNESDTNKNSKLEKIISKNQKSFTSSENQKTRAKMMALKQKIKLNRKHLNSKTQTNIESDEKNDGGSIAKTCNNREKSFETSKIDNMKTLKSEEEKSQENATERKSPRPPSPLSSQNTNLESLKANKVNLNSLRIKRYNLIAEQKMSESIYANSSLKNNQHLEQALNQNNQNKDMTDDENCYNDEYLVGNDFEDGYEDDDDDDDNYNDDDEDDDDEDNQYPDDDDYEDDDEDNYVNDDEDDDENEEDEDEEAEINANINISNVNKVLKNNYYKNFSNNTFENNTENQDDNNVDDNENYDDEENELLLNKSEFLVNENNLNSSSPSNGDLMAIMMMTLNGDHLSINGGTSSSLATTALPTIITPFYVTDNEYLAYSHQKSPNKIKNARGLSKKYLSKNQKVIRSKMVKDSLKTQNAEKYENGEAGEENKIENSQDQTNLEKVNEDGYSQQRRRSKREIKQEKEKSNLNFSNPNYDLNNREETQDNNKEASDPEINVKEKLLNLDDTLSSSLSKIQEKNLENEIKMRKIKTSSRKRNRQSLTKTRINSEKENKIDNISDQSRQLTIINTDSDLTNQINSSDSKNSQSITTNSNELNNPTMNETNSFKEIPSKEPANISNEASVHQHEMKEAESSTRTDAVLNTTENKKKDGENITETASEIPLPKTSIKATSSLSRMLSATQKRVSFVVTSNDTSNEKENRIILNEEVDRRDENETQNMQSQKVSNPEKLEESSESYKSSLLIKPLVTYKQKPLPKLDSIYHSQELNENSLQKIKSQQPENLSIERYKNDINSNNFHETNNELLNTQKIKTRLNSSLNTELSLSAEKKLPTYLPPSLLSKRQTQHTPTVTPRIIASGSAHKTDLQNSNTYPIKTFQHQQSINSSITSVANRKFIEMDTNQSKIEISRIYSASNKLNKQFSISTNDLPQTSKLKLPPVINTSGSTNNINSISINEGLNKKKITDLSRYCYFCQRKTGLASSYICRCGNNYCTQHRNAEAHNCTFDYKTEGRKLIEHSNPLVAAPKLPKI